jgi:hypothetical protein
MVACGAGDEDALGPPTSKTGSGNGEGRCHDPANEDRASLLRFEPVCGASPISEKRGAHAQGRSHSLNRGAIR